MRRVLSGLAALVVCSTTSSWSFAQAVPDGDAPPPPEQPDQPEPESAPTGDDVKPDPSGGTGPNPWAEGVSEDAQAEALRLYRKGNDQFGRGEYSEALQVYRQAIESWRHPAILYNIGVCMIELDKRVDAYRFIEEALKFGAAPLGPRVFDQASRDLKLLSGQVGKAQLKCTQPGVSVTVDGASALDCPGEATMLLLTGTHQMVATREGFMPEKKELVVEPNQVASLDVQLEPIRAPVFETRFPRWVPWTVLGVGAAIAAGGIPLQLFARNNFNDYDAFVNGEFVGGFDENGDGFTCEELNGPEPGCVPPEKYDDKRERARLQNRLAIASWITGGAIAVGGLAMVILNRPREVTEQPPIQITPMAGPDRVGAALTWGF